MSNPDDDRLTFGSRLERAIEEKSIPMVDLKRELRELCDMLDNEKLEPEERAAAEGQIRLYIQANIRKVDNVRSFWRFAEDMLASAKRDYEDDGKRVRQWESKLEFLKALCVDVMVEFKEKRLDGEHGYIRLQVNGGPVSLEIYSPALVPEELVLYRGWMSAAAMAKIAPEITAREDFQFEREPRLGAIKAELETKCVPCHGSGLVKDPYGNPENEPLEPCWKCAGTGKRLVAGARLGVRGVHARIR